MQEHESLGQQDERDFNAAQGSVRPKPDGKQDPAGEAGWYLQREREKLGYTYEDIADVTGFHPLHLAAIELGDLTHLPNRTEAVNMIGHYAQILGFDPQPLVMHYAKFLPRPGQPLKAHPADPAPLSSAKVMRFGRFPKFPPINMSAIPGGAGGIVASVFGVMLLFGGATYLFSSGKQPDVQAGIEDTLATSSTGEQAGEIKSVDEPMPDTLVTDEAAAAAEEAPPGDAAVGEEDALGAFIEETVTQQPKKKSKAKAQSGPADETEAISAATGEVQVTANGRLFGAENQNARLVLKAKAPVWVRIEDAQGSVVMTQMLMKGDIYRVPDREGLMLIARDGGLLAFEIDGKEKGVLGPPGEILVGRSLDLKELAGNG